MDNMFEEMSRKASDASTHIRVAVRIRPMNANERQERCTNIVQVDKGKTSVQCKGKGFGPFYRVYDSSTTQEMIYDDLVSSQIRKVIAGFNCTVFAYGQTGTGKTFTMEGGSKDARSSKEDTTTGIIPRSIEDIFEQIEKTGCEEYSLRVSYVELYNEELIDLLSVNSDINDRERLRIFDDPNKKGVIVSGVEEVPVRCRSDVYKLLEMGAERRKTAATLMNMNSSRSHSLFMVNVVIRENSIKGEELVKQGKLNLVDLAGSENIGRSGALGNRAKEAGSINQSLLTLGRVIRSLTTNAQHIPYRESKLTRLLQDSLGGSTITSLIATLSPASSNFEESQSTLEYAARAANIKNKPVCNTKVTKKTILREYSEEIEKLRRDLRAAREKNGVIISEESHEEYQKNAERVRDLEEQLSSTVDRLYRFTEDLVYMDEQYRILYSHNDELEQRLTLRIRQIAEKEKELAETQDKLTCYVGALDKMHIAALHSFSQLKQMRDSADDMRYDLKSFWGKVDSMAEESEENGKICQQFLKHVNQSANALNDITAKNLECINELSSKLNENVNEFKGSVAQSSKSICDVVENGMKEFHKIKEMEERSYYDMESKFKDNMTNIKDKIVLNTEKLNELYNTFASEALQKSDFFFQKINFVENQLASMSRTIDEINDSSRKRIRESTIRRNDERDNLNRNIAIPCSDLIEEMRNMQKYMQDHFAASLEKLTAMKSSTCESIDSMKINSNADEIAFTQNADDVYVAFDSHKQAIYNEFKGCQEEHSSLKATANVYGTQFTDQTSQIGADIDEGNNSFRTVIEGTQMENRMRQKMISDNIESMTKNKDSIVISMDHLESCMTNCMEEFNAKLSTEQGKHKDDSNETISCLLSAAESFTLKKISATENAPARVTPPVLTEKELDVPPHPEDLLGDIDEGENDENQYDLGLNQQIKRKRRVSEFVRRDSLLSLPKNFMSPESILRKRNEAIEEEIE